MIREVFKYRDGFIFESGERLEELDIVYHHTGNRRPGREVIWICHALTANSNPEEWWDGLVGPGKLFDTLKYYIICANMIGSCYGSSGPSTLSPSGEPYLLSFPQVTVRDIVKAHNLLREELRIENIDLIAGGSIGGFQALEWSIMFPGIIRNLLVIACNARVSAWGTAFNESQRMALFADSTFAEAKNIRGGERGLRGARSIALISYRSYKGYYLTQSEKDEDALFAEMACSYQQYQGKKLSDRFDAYSYYTLTRSVDSHNCGRGRGGVEKALDKIMANTVVVGIDSDNLFPVEEQKLLHKYIKNSKLELLESEWGHDGFLLEWEQTQKIVKRHINFIS
ncbi:MAG: homoserine O-acetyltransferase [Bacteroidales bacterium]|nr:homoserine O-acetyltransferase [Bacteroidales bacterium]